MIDSYSFGEIRIDGKTYTHDIIIYPDKIDSNWWRKTSHLLEIQDLKGVITEAPDILIIGTGAYGAISVSGKIIENLEIQGIEVVVESTKKACEIFNKLQSTKKVIAALHLTC